MFIVEVLCCRNTDFFGQTVITKSHNEDTTNRPYFHYDINTEIQCEMENYYYFPIMSDTKRWIV